MNGQPVSVGGYTWGERWQPWKLAQMTTLVTVPGHDYTTDRGLNSDIVVLTLSKVSIGLFTSRF